MDGNADQKRRRIHETSSSDIDGLSDQLQSVSLAISAAMDRGSGDGPEDDMQDSPVQTGMEELRRWYQTEVFAASDAQQHRWEERRWAFLGQLQHALRKPLTHTVFTYNIDALLADSSGNESNLLRDSSPPANDCDAVNSAFGGLLFVGRSRYNDIVVADETVSRVHCIIVRSNGTVGVFDGWSSYGTLTLERGRADRDCEESAVDNRRPLLFDEGESFTLRVGKNATIKFPG
mmetsp:Transcript_6138/g.20925  ORF Transcript_6138/g.20925 Transcript_6138/m.20925 type:complete len:233 (+) Transcript_6138:102-800(+)